MNRKHLTWLAGAGLAATGLITLTLGSGSALAGPVAIEAPDQATNASTTPAEPTEPTGPEDEGTCAAEPAGETAPAYRLVSYEDQRKCKTIDVKLRPLTVFETKEVPIVGDTLQFEVIVDIKSDLRDLVFEVAGKKVDTKKVTKVVFKCEVTRVADGADGLAVDCQPKELSVTVKGEKDPVTVKFPETQDKFTGGVAVVK